MPVVFQRSESLDSTTGPMFIGVLIGAILYGLIIMQAYIYFSSFPKDALHLKILVTVLVLSDAVHLSLVAQLVYYDSISTYFDHTALNCVSFSLPIQSLFTSVNAGIVQYYFALHSWKLGKSNLLLLLIFILTLAQNACVVAWVSLVLKFGTYTELVKLSPLALANSSLSAAIDVIIATRLIVLLHRSRTGLNRSDKLINKIILFVVSTGLLTSMCAIFSVVLVAAFPQALIGSAFYFCIGRLYTNSFIATLNARSSAIRIEDEATNQFTSVTHDVVTTCISIDKS